MVSKIIFNLNYQIMEKEPVRILTLLLCNWTKKTQGTTWRKRVPPKKSFFFFFFFKFKFFNHIIILNLNDKIMEKEPVRVLTLDISMWWNQKKKKKKTLETT